MNLACHTIAFHSYPLQSAIKKIAEIGFDGIELNAETNWAQPHITPDTPPAERREMARLVVKSGLEVSSICAHTNLIEMEIGRRKDAMRYMRGCIDIATEFDTRTVHAISGAPGHDSSDHEQVMMMMLLASEIEELLDYARSKDVRLAIEAAVNQLVCNSGTLAELLQSVDRRAGDGGGRLFVNFDPSHYVLYGEDPAEVAERLGGRIVHVHAKDSAGTPAGFSFPPIGMGIVNFAKVIGVLRASGYDGFISVEYEGELFGYEKDPVRATARAKEFLSKLLLSSDTDPT